MSPIEEFLYWLAELNLWEGSRHVFGLLWLFALIILFFRRLVVLMPGKHDQKSILKRILSYRTVAATSFCIAWFLQVVVDEGITFIFNLISGSWSMIEFQKGAFTIEKLIMMKADSYLQLWAFFTVFSIANVWQYFQFTKRTAFWLGLVMLYQGILSYLHIWNHHAYSGTTFLWVFYLTYPEFRILTGFLGSNLVRKPASNQNTEIERKWFDKFPFQKDLRDYSEFKKVAAFFRLDEKKGLMLDAGCGHGDLDRKLSSLGFRVIGVDISHKMLEANSSERIQANAIQMPIRSQSCDYVFCAGFLHHFNNLHEILPELKRCLKHEGRLLIYEPSGSNLLERVANTLGHAMFPASWLMKHGATPNEKLHNLQEYSSALRKTGFTVKQKDTIYVGNRIFLPFGITRLISLAHKISLWHHVTDTHILIEASL